jgi:hypothetical protein
MDALTLAAVAAALAVAALAWALWQRRRLHQLRDQLEKLEVQFNTLQEQSRLELLGIGQRVMEGDKQLRRFGDRLEALEVGRSPAERYGQLGGLQLGGGEQGEQPSMGEAELLALLRRQQEQNPGN